MLKVINIKIQINEPCTSKAAILLKQKTDTFRVEGALKRLCTFFINYIYRNVWDLHLPGKNQFCNPHFFKT